MKAKSAINHAKTALVLALCGVVLTVESQADDGFSKALNEGATACLTIRVVDDEGNPVQGASIESRFDAAFKASGSVKAFLTDTNGIAEISGQTGKAVAFRASKVGYYGASDKICYVTMGQGVKDGRWLPFDLDRMVVLRRIQNPVADRPHVSGARYTKNLGIWMGFDLAKYDFVAPNGNGDCADMEVKFDWDGQRGVNFHGMDVSIRFAGPYSGAYYQDRMMMCDFKEAYFAVTNEVYQKEFNFYSRPIRDDGGTIIKRSQKLFDSDKALIIRSRCITNTDGMLEQANYSEIVDLTFGCSSRGAWIMFQPIFNPTPNDTNLEPKR